jgi:O-antigen/teichoic acid export membrane protein
MNDNSSGTASRLAGQSGLVIAGNAFTLLVGLPFQIYLARVLGAEQLGAFSLFDVVAQTAGALAALGLSYTIVLFMFWGLRLHLLRLGHTRDNVLRETRRLWWSYSRTIYASSLLGMAIAPFERFLIGTALDLASLGIWTAVRQLQSLPQVFLQVIITLSAPMFVGAKAKGEMDDVTHPYRIATDWVGRLGFPLLIFLAIFGDKVLALYGGRFADTGRWPLLILILGQFVNSATGLVGTLLNQL